MRPFDLAIWLVLGFAQVGSPVVRITGPDVCGVTGRLLRFVHSGALVPGCCEICTDRLSRCTSGIELLIAAFLRAVR